MAHGKSPRHTRSARKRRAGKALRTDPSSPTEPKTAVAPLKRPRRAPVADAAMRLQKLLAAAGFGSRREVERFLIDERVTVNGRVAALGDRADPMQDEIRLDGERVLRERPAYWVLNKPRGIVTTVRDEEGRRTVMQLLPDRVGRLFPVGRLDKETSGLLLLTNDGDCAHALLHPSLGNEREYHVNVKGELDAKAIGRLERGVSLEEGRTSPARVSHVRFDPEAGTTNLTLTLGEGRKRQIRRSLLVLGFPVRRLARVRMGPLRLGRLPVGEARPLRSEEKRALLEHVAWLRGERDTPPAESVRPTRGPARESRRHGSSSTSSGTKRQPRKKAARRGAARNASGRKQAGKRRGAASKGPKSAGPKGPKGTTKITAKSGKPPSGPRGGSRGGPKKGGAQKRARSKKGPSR